MTDQQLQNKIKTEEYFINMGPQHPAAHGVLRLILTILSKSLFIKQRI